MARVGGSASQQVKDLEAFQRKSAAIETVFTMAILYLGILQIIPLSGIVRNLALVPVIILLVIALHLGWKNLWNQIKEA